MKNILILNASPQGSKSNCARLVKTQILPKLSQQVKCEVVHLAEFKSYARNKKLNLQIQRADGFLFTTGTYWDSWGSPLQKYLEEMTHLESTPAYIGKPAAVVVLNHSVGGKSILSRLQGVLVTLGCMIPPLSGMVYGLNTDLAIRKKSQASEQQKDFWSLDDLEIILGNLLKSLQINVQWDCWPVDRKNFKKLWIK